MRLKCLGDKTVVEAEVSDHNPVLYTTADKISYCSFNILTQCKQVPADPPYFNNGFHITETDKEYKQRLLVITEVIEEIVLSYNVAYLMLQEAPLAKIGAEFYQVLQEKLDWMQVDFTHAFRSVGGVEPFGGVMTIYRNDLNLLDLTEQFQPQICPENRDRMQVYMFENAKSHTCKIANLHSNFKNQSGTKADIEFLIKHDMLVAGDFNLLEAPNIGQFPAILQRTDLGLFPAQTLDGIIDSRVVGRTLLPG